MIAENYENVSAGAGDCESTVNDCVSRGAEQISHIIEQRPVRSLLLICFAGFGTGFLISRLFSDDSARRSTFDRGTAERFGRQMLEKLEHVMPAMVRERFTK